MSKSMARFGMLLVFLVVLWPNWIIAFVAWLMFILWIWRD